MNVKQIIEKDIELNKIYKVKEIREIDGVQVYILNFR